MGVQYTQPFRIHGSLLQRRMRVAAPNIISRRGRCREQGSSRLHDQWQLQGTGPHFPVVRYVLCRCCAISAHYLAPEAHSVCIIHPGVQVRASQQNSRIQCPLRDSDDPAGWHAIANTRRLYAYPSIPRPPSIHLSLSFFFLSPPSRTVGV